jgi:hypothetical protein
MCLEVVMSTVKPLLVVPPHVDHVLNEIGKTLQITPSQYERAKSAYGAVGDWLEDSASPLAPYRPEIYPQGSMALRTTVRPLRGEEFDLDLVCELEGWTGTAMQIYKAVGDRLAENETYRKMLEGKKRCWRLNYSGDFHLDALPGREDENGPTFSIEVPDRSVANWKPSNPKGYVLWFEERARPFYALLEARKAPLPAFDPADAGDPLRRAVQLLKRHRDIRFDGDPENAPRSIVLTTLAAKHYTSQESVGEALLGILMGIQAEIAFTDGVLEVRNPVNEAENFADAWENNEKAYREFVDYVDQFARDLQALFTAPLNEQFSGKTERLFGGNVAKKAIETYNVRHGGRAAAALTNISAGAGAVGRPWYRD